MKKLFDYVFRDGTLLYTENSTPGKRFYGERLFSHAKIEYREWNPTRSKLGAAIMNGLKTMAMQQNSTILYLGASTGTTVSHVSDIARDGVVYAIEFSERVFRGLTELAAVRTNVVPIYADARKPETYFWVELCDVVFVDISQSDEVEIAIRNAAMFLRPNGTLMIAVKSQSIDVTKDPKRVYAEATKKLKEAGFTVSELVDLEPYEKKHAMIVATKNKSEFSTQFD
ncbi:MAG: fibrillarin-like rRNA/tRNA 2'-O-methyltransferase [Candidatus Aenigmarchaeota archaeon]|nr:fibrillarin-like rRNA/tRNA 2'-O-methyltransferase [Candidatus Aenigmarchaeota archaeon]